MAKKKLVDTDPVLEEGVPNSEAPTAEAFPDAPEVVSEEVKDEPVCNADVSFDDVQIKTLSEAGLEPAQVRNECGLAVKDSKGKGKITFSEALKRAVAKYLV